VILVDTSVWIDHLRRDDQVLATALEQERVLIHPFVIGELACGNLKNRSEVLALLHKLPQTMVASDAEVLSFIERRNLMGRGIGYLDAHLLASAALETVRLWTRDRQLAAAARALNLTFEEDW
jgi:predicted nucleic acid-binding protein